MVFDWNFWGKLSAFALIAFVPLSFWMFARQRPAKAAILVLLLAFMWLPEVAAFDFPVVPPLNKFSIAALCALMGAYWKARPRLRAARFGRGWDWFVIIMVLAEIGTVATNGDALVYGNWKRVELPAFTPYDGVSAAIRDLLDVGLPFLLGRVFLRSGRDLRDVMGALVVGGLIYSVPALWELRMSPMLHQQVYGFAARTDWLQNIRAGGYRPTIFMGHGLVVGFFMFLCTTAAVALHKAGRRGMLGVSMGLIVGFMFLMLLLVKAAAAIIYGLVGLLVLRYLNVKNQMRIMLLLAAVVVSYPAARLTGIFPTETLLAGARMMGPEREQSLQFRFDMEDILVLKAEERPWFGWGGFARERVYDPDTGKDLVIQDGHWIVVFGRQGIVGFVCYFMLLLLPVWQAARRMKTIPSKADRTLVAALAFMVSVCAINMLPNMLLPNLQFFFAGGLAVLLKELPKQAALDQKAALSKRPPDPVQEVQTAARSGIPGTLDRDAGPQRG
jgi:O-antigen ligase